jgi:hypothetical protein
MRRANRESENALRTTADGRRVARLAKLRGADGIVASPASGDTDSLLVPVALTVISTWSQDNGSPPDLDVGPTGEPLMVSELHEPADVQLAAVLARLQEERGHKWAQANDADSHPLHGLFQYPAMMVPQMQHDILRVLRAEFDLPRVWDGFVGSGTTLAASMNLGLDFVGRDINPLAILICRVKAGPYHVAAFARSAQRVLDRSRIDSGRKIEVIFPNWQKWFRLSTGIALSRIRRAVLAEASLACRRFHWLALAETVRLCSNSRISTVKLHARPPDEIRTREVDVYGVFRSTLLRNLERLEEQRDWLAEQGLVRSGHYTRDVQLELGDIREVPTRAASCQIGLTSPPYGDNTSTVTYGQQAYLPLRWIHLGDIHPRADDAVVANTHALDSMSLGGSKRLEAGVVAGLCNAAPSLKSTFDRLKSLPRDRTNRVAAFFRDFEAALPAIVGRVESGGVMAWTVGNRQVGGGPVPLDEALVELLAPHDVKQVCRLERAIPPGRKRMAVRNGHAETIGSETVLVFRRN